MDITRRRLGVDFLGLLGHVGHGVSAMNKAPEEYTIADLRALSDQELLEIEYQAKSRYTEVRNRITDIRAERFLDKEIKAARETV